MKQKILAVIIILLMLFGIGVYFYPKTEKASVPIDIKNTTITMERGACEGTCPIYTLTIYGNGTVVYNGKVYVKVVGVKTESIDEEKIRQIVSEFESIGFFSRTYGGNYIAIDLPTTIISLTVNGKTKSLEHSHGTHSEPEEIVELINLETKIDEVTNSEQWVK